MTNDYRCGSKPLIMLRRATVRDDEASKQLASRAWQASPRARQPTTGYWVVKTFGSNLKFPQKTEEKK